MLRREVISPNSGYCCSSSIAWWEWIVFGGAVIASFCIAELIKGNSVEKRAVCSRKIDATLDNSFGDALVYGAQIEFGPGTYGFGPRSRPTPVIRFAAPGEPCYMTPVAIDLVLDLPYCRFSSYE